MKVGVDGIRSVHQPIGKLAVWITSGRTFGKIAKLFMEYYLVQLLGFHFNTFTWLRALIESLAQLSCLGLDNSLIRFAGKENESDRKATIIVVTMLLGTLISAGVALLVFLSPFNNVVDKKIAYGALILMIGVPIITFLRLSTLGWRVMNEGKGEFVYRELIPVATFLFLLWALNPNTPLVAAIALIFSSGLSAILGLISFLRHFFSGVREAVSVVWGLRKIVPIRSELSFALPLFAASLQSFLLFRADRVMLGLMGYSGHVGVYHIGALVASQVAIIHDGFADAFAPRIAAAGEDSSEIKLEYRQLTRFIVSMTSLLIILIGLLGKQILGIFSPEYVSGAEILRVLLVGQLVSIGVGPIGVYLSMRGHQKLLMVNSIIVGLTNLMLNLILIPWHGALGAALATTVSLSIGNILPTIEALHVEGVRFFDIDYFTTLLPPTLVCVVFFTDLFYIGFIGNLLTGVLVYVSLYLILGIWRKDYDFVKRCVQLR